MTGTKQKRQLFPEKLWDLVNNQPASGIYWSKNGKRIEIDRAQLEKFLQLKEVHPSGWKNDQAPASQLTTLSSSASSAASSSSQNFIRFRSHNFDSFIRQLHFYGFKKSGNSYYHEKFQRDKPEALNTMKRKYSTLAPISNSNNQTTIPTMLPHATSITRQLSSSSQHASSIVSNHQRGSGSQPTSNNKSASKSSQSGSTLATEVPVEARSLEAPPQDIASSSLSCTKNSQRCMDTIKMYTIDTTTCDDEGHLSFTNVRETSVKAIRDEKCVKISIPDLMLNNHPDDSWPKTLVLENQNILSAYFIYKLN